MVTQDWRAVWFLRYNLFDFSNSIRSIVQRHERNAMLSLGEGLKDKQINWARQLVHNLSLDSGEDFMILKLAAKQRLFQNDAFWSEIRDQLADIKKNSHPIQFLSEGFRNRRSDVLNAVKIDGMAIQYTVNFQKDFEIALAAVQQNGLAIQFLKYFWNNEYIISEAVKQNWHSAQFLCEYHKNNEIAALAAVTQNGKALRYFEYFQNSSKVAKRAVEQNGLAAEYIKFFRRNAHVDQRIKDDDYTVALAAVEQNGLAIKYLPYFKIDPKIALAAVEQNGLAIQYLKEFQDPFNKDSFKIALAAVEQNGLAIQYLSSSLQNHAKIAMAAVQQNGLALQYIEYFNRTYRYDMDHDNHPDHISWNSDEIKKEALKQNPQIRFFLNKIL